MGEDGHDASYARDLLLVIPRLIDIVVTAVDDRVVQRALFFDVGHSPRCLICLLFKLVALPPLTARLFAANLFFNSSALISRSSKAEFDSITSASIKVKTFEETCSNPVPAITVALEMLLSPSSGTTTATLRAGLSM